MQNKPLKIAYLAQIRLPTEKAHGLQIMKTCEAMANNGAEVTLIVPKRKNEIKEDPFTFYNIKKNFNIVYTPFIDLTHLGMIGFIFNNLFFAESAALYTRKHGFEIIYSRDEWVLFNQILLDRKLFWEAHDGSNNFVTKILVKFISGLVVISEGLGKYYQKLGFKKEFSIARDAIDLKDFKIEVSKDSAREKVGLPKDKRIILSNTSLGAWKGAETLAECALKDNNPNNLYVFVGGSAKDVERFKNNYKRDNLLFLGFKKYEEMPLYLNSADVLVTANSGKYEISKYFTSPMKLFEHLATGLPMVVSDLPSMREIVSENEVRFFEPDNSESLLKVVSTIFVQYDEEKNKSQNNKIFVEKFSYSKRALIILNFVEKYELVRSETLEKIYKIVLFLVGGGTTLLVQLTTMSTCLYIFDLHYIASGTIAFIFGIVYNFFFQKFFVFKNKDKAFYKQLMFFCANGGVNYILNISFLYFFVDFLHFNPLIAQTITVSVIAFYNFIVYSFIFKK